MISLTSRSARICDRPSLAFGVLLRPNSISGVRFASLTSAIERGKRQSLSVEERGGRHFQGRDKQSFEDRGNRSFEDRRNRSFEDRGTRSYEDRGNRSYEERGTRSYEKRDGNTSPPRPREFGREWDRPTPRSEFRNPQFEFDTEEFIKTGDLRTKKDNSRFRDRDSAQKAAYRDKPDESNQLEPHWVGRGHLQGRERSKGKKGRNHHKYSDEFPERVKSSVLVPSSIPYTTAASVFIYGASAVEAALRCSRRKLYKLYIYQGEGEELTSQQNVIRKMALAQGITVKMAFAGWDAMMDKMSLGRPHNGFVLEASPLPTLPITNLEPVTDPTANVFHVRIGSQSAEEAKVNGVNSEVQRAERYDEASKSRFPLILMIDGIVDPGNAGAIIRSAYYLGVDGIVYGGRNSAPISPIAAKASAGATESMTFFKTVNPQEFVQASRKNGWRFLAADSPGNVYQRSGDVASMDRASGSNTLPLLTEAPTVLMLGNEGTGLMERLKARADGLISIPGARFRPAEGIKDDAGVDSLNVSVAAAMLIEMLMRTPLQVTPLPDLSALEKQEKVEQKQTPPPSEPQEVAPPSFDFNN